MPEPPAELVSSFFFSWSDIGISLIGFAFCTPEPNSNESALSFEFGSGVQKAKPIRDIPMSDHEKKNDETNSAGGSGIRYIFIVSFVLALLGVSLIWFLAP